MKNLLMLVDAPSIIIIFLSILIVSAVTGNYTTLIRGINCVFSKKYHLTASELSHVISLFKLLEKTNLYIGICTSIAGLILAYENIITDFLFKIGVLLLPIFYAALINLLFFCPACFILQYRNKNVKE